MKFSTIVYQAALKIYSVLPFKKAVCVLMRAMPLKKDKFYRDYKFEGPFRVMLDSNKSFQLYHHKTTIENEIFWNGIDEGWEKISLKLWRQLASKSKFIVDIGANTGIYSLLAKSVNPDAKIYAFEPSKRVYDKLVQNNKLNDFDINTLDIAISNQDGEATFYDFNSEHQYSASLNKAMFSEDVLKKEVNVQTRTLQSFFEEAKIEGLDLIKIDVEKHEAEVIEGMGDLITKFRPTLLVEILEDEIGESIENALKSLGYLYFNIDELNPPVKVERLKKSAHYNYLICNQEIARELNLI